MKILLMKLKGIYYRLVGIEWIYLSYGNCQHVPVYIVVEEK